MTTDSPSSGERYIIVSADSHIGPSLEHQLREYCPKHLLDEFDLHVAANRPVLEAGPPVKSTMAESHAARIRLWECEGQKDSEARLADMDAEGVAANVIFAGGLNGEALPFGVDGLSREKSPTPDELVPAGIRIFNAWLADFCSTAPARHLGVMQLPVTVGVERAIEEITWGKEHGLTAINFPAPRADFPSYNDPIWEPFWSAVEDIDLPLCTHVGGGERALGTEGPGGMWLALVENNFMARRALWQMAFAGVFERHPRLKLIFTEQRAGWVKETLDDLQSLYDNDVQNLPRASVPRSPREYWAQSCWVTASMLAPFEVDRRDEIGFDHLMWGGDYPHVEGTWPRTALALRNTFSHIPEDEVRAMLGDHAIEAFGLDRDELRRIADKIGPTPEEIARPLLPAEEPSFRGFAFRRTGAFA